jgi:hypothetical protein
MLSRAELSAAVASTLLQVDVTEYTFKLALLQRKYEQVGQSQRGKWCLVLEIKSC